MRGNMFPIRPALVNLSPNGLGRILYALTVLLASFAFAAGEPAPVDSLSAPPVQQPSADSVLAAFDSVVKTDSVVSADSTVVDSSLKKQKSVLYLSGGEDSPWFYLGVLYAIEEYHVPVDSIVGTSWGAWVGFMWSRGMRLDDMQRLFLEEDFEPFVGHDFIVEKTEWNTFDWPISLEGIPSLRYRFALRSDSTGIPHRIPRPLILDTAGVERALGKLRLQESLYRQSVKSKIPFSVLACDGTVGNTSEDVLKSLPWLGNSESGEICPYLALPAEDSPDEYPIIAIADPVRANLTGNPWQRALKKYAGEGLNNRPGLIVRAHSIPETSHNALIQAGFSAMEKRVNSLPFEQDRRKNYEEMKSEVYPWFRYNPTFDSLSAEKHINAKSYWDEGDTGIVAPRRFAYALTQNPVYDSLMLDMQSNGDLIVGAKSSPVFDIALGGFGSNAFGPNVYGEMGVRFINQMEFNVNVAGFWGNNSYGLRPYFDIDRLWNKNWSLSFAYEWQNVRPLKSFNDELPHEDRIYSEHRSDLSASVTYLLTATQSISLSVMFGNREFEMDTLAYEEQFFNTYPVSPSLHFEQYSGKRDKWFATEGYAINADLGLEAIGFELGRADFIPIYWKGEVDAYYAVSPRKFATFIFGAAGGIEQYHEEGFGYEYPKDFDYAVLSNCYRFQPQATPWSTEWYNSTLASHHYGLLRMSAALHYKGSGLWLYGAYIRDFESNPSVILGANKVVMEPTFRFVYRSINVLAGMSRTVDFETAGDLNKFDDYKYFIRIGNYNLF